jgi:2-keto-4-pentenoate hydratase/2-oxohepta-3-ene-1,7-dioic acid hydratase in catechol pathway
MRYGKFTAKGVTAHCEIEGDTVHQVSGLPWSQGYKRTGQTYRLSEVKLLAPIQHPGKVFAMALNYGSHLHDAPKPERPEPFLKPSTSICGPGDPIVLPRDSNRIDAESELVAVIGKQAKNVSEKDALSYVYGYTCGNDVSARDWQRGDKSWWRAKGSDSFSPIGPWIETNVDPSKVTIVGRINGKEAQRCHGSEMIFNVAQCVSFISKYVTLMPGDMIFTGTSGTPDALKPGDKVDIEISGIGTLSNVCK